MKKTKAFCSVCLAIIMVITLCACSQRGGSSSSGGNELVVSGNESLSNENPFDISVVDKENSEVGFYSFGIDEIAELTLPETTVRLQTSNGEIAQEIGFMVFVDGIPQPIGDTYCKPVSLAEKEESLHEVHFTPRLPAGKAAGEDSNILVSSILRPSFRPSEENGYAFGHCLSIRDLIPQDISASESIEGAPLVGLRCEDMTAIDEDFVLSELKTSLPQEGSSDIVLLCQEADTKGSTMFIDADGSLRFSLYGIASGGNTYRVSVFVNNMPVVFNGSYDYADMVLRSGNMTKLDITLDPTLVGSGDVIYAIAVPIEYEADSLLKTQNKFLLDEKNTEVEFPDPEKPATQQPSAEQGPAGQQTHNTGDGNLLFEENLLLLGYLNTTATAWTKDNRIIGFDTEGTVQYQAALPEGFMIIKAEILHNKIAVHLAAEPDMDMPPAGSGFTAVTNEADPARRIQIYDSSLNLLSDQTLDFLNEMSLVSVSMDGSSMVYTKNNNGGTLYLSDLSGNNEQVLHTLSAQKGEPVLFFAIAFTDAGVVYSAAGSEKLSQYDNDMYYGLVTLSGANEYLRDDAVGSDLQTFSSGAFLPDRNVPYGQQSKGIVRIVNGSDFSTLSTQIKNQSQSAVISSDGSRIITRIIHEKEKTAEIVVYDVQSGNVVCTYTEGQIANIVRMIANGDELLVSYNLPDNTMKTVLYPI